MACTETSVSSRVLVRAKRPARRRGAAEGLGQDEEGPGGLHGDFEQPRVTDRAMTA